MTAGGCSAVG